VCYPNSVLINIRIRGLTAEQIKALIAEPGLDCSDVDDDTVRARIEIAHDIPSWPDLGALQTKVKVMVADIAPQAQIVDVRAGYRYAHDTGSPAEAALHRLRSRAGVLAGDLGDVELGELLTAVLRDFTVLDGWLREGGSLPPDWARRHPAGDPDVARRLTTAEPQMALAAS
jgi:hypothetical protein